MERDCLEAMLDARTVEHECLGVGCEALRLGVECRGVELEAPGVSAMPIAP